MKAEAMYSSEEEDQIRAGAGEASNEQGGEKKQGSMNRRLSAESQDFEFNKVGGVAAPHMRGQNMLQGGGGGGGGGLASADELFYKGQLLPLQYSTRPPYIINSTSNSPISPSASCHIDSSCIDIPSSKLSLSSLRDQDVRFSSCRLDHLPGLDSSLFEFTRSSSFRSQYTSNYSPYYCNFSANYASNCTHAGSSSWDSCSTAATATTAATSSGGESSSSSRDSNGSSQDSYTSSDNNRDQHVCSHGHVLSGVNGPFSTSSCPKRKPGFMQSWKLLFNGFRRGSTQSTTGAGAGRGDHQAHNIPSSQPRTAGGDDQGADRNRSVHGSMSSGSGAVAVGPNGINEANQGITAGAADSCGCKLGKEKSSSGMQIRSPMRKASLLWAQEKGRMTDAMRRGNECENCECKKLEKESRRGGNYMYAGRGSRWQGYTRRIKPISIIKATLGGGHANNLNIIRSEQQLQGQLPAAGDDDQSWLLKGRVPRPATPSLQRKASQPSLVSVSGVNGPSKVFFSFHAVSSSSCPASVRSSPNHSGLLASPAFNNMSTMQELHSAVQGAIAHCKQSISSPSSN